MDQALLDASANREIDPDDAFRFATEKKKFIRYLTDTDLVQSEEFGDNGETPDE